MKSSISTTGTSPSVAPPTRSFTVLLIDGSRLRVTCQDLAIQLRQERNSTLKRLREARAKALANVADRISEARIRHEFEAAERETDAAIRRLSKMVRVRPEARRRSSRRPSPSAPTSIGPVRAVFTQRTASALARRDRLGREGIMLRIRYIRAGGKHASRGCLRRHYRYIAREAAVTVDSKGEPIVLGNMGVTVDEITDALDLQEQMLRGMRKNAKLGFSMIGAFPYGFPVDARRKVLQRIGDEVFGKRGLPWNAAAHDTDPGAKVENPHFHFGYGLLPMELQADGSLVISNDLRTDLDGPEGLRFIRHSVARILTEVAQEHGLDRAFTALSYGERGMDREGGEHVGQEGTAAHRRGEHVAAIARNEAKQRLADARYRAKRARERVNALEQLKLAITAAPAAPSIEAELFPEEAAEVIVPEPAPAATGSVETVELPAAAPNPASFAAAPEDGMIGMLGRAATTGSSPPVISDFDAAPGSIVAPDVLALAPKAPVVDPLPAIIATSYLPPPVPVAEPPYVIVPAAPVTNAVPAMTTIGRPVSVTVPPGVIPVGRPIGGSTVAAPILWVVGKKASIDPADALAEQHLADAIARAEEGRRIAEAERAEQSAPPMPARASSAKELRRRALEEMFAAIAEERHFLKQQNGVVVVEPHLLALFGLSQSDMTEAAVLGRLSELADRQAAEISQIASHVRASPHDIVPDGDGWRLDDAAPDDIRLLVAAWRNDATLQQALGRLVATRPDMASPSIGARTAADPKGTARRESDQPGANQIRAVPSVARRFPLLPGQGMGD